MKFTKGGAPLRLVTYNIHKGIGGLDRRYDLERTIAVLRATQADLMLLQEVDEGARRSRHVRQVDALGEALGMPHRAFFPNVVLKEGHYGNALLSRFPIDHVENLDLTQPFKKRRGALHARLSLEWKGRPRRVWLYNVHLGLAEYERRAQLKRLLRWHHEHRVHASTTVVVAGDMNDVWRKLGPLILEPGGFSGAAARPPTFPAMRPIRPLDAVFVRGPARITRCNTPEDRIAREASDHLPLLVSLRLG